MQIALVPYEHDDDVLIGVLGEFLQPSGDGFERVAFGDVINEKGADGASIKGGGYCTVALLAGSVPDLSLDDFGTD